VIPERSVKAVGLIICSAILSGFGQCQTLAVPPFGAAKMPSAMIDSGLPKFHMQSSDLSGGTAINPPDREIPSTFKGWVNRGLQDQKQILVAPFHKKNLKWDALFLGTTGLLIAYDEQAARAVPRSYETPSHWASNAAIVGTSLALGTVFFSGLKNDNDHAKETGYLAIEALANTFTIYTATQLIAARQRPFQGSGEGAFFKDHSVNTSFPAGHAMFTFVMASTIAHEYPKPWVQVLAYGAATAVAGARFTGRNHFPSDLMVGSVLGYLIGTHIFHSHCKFGLSPACHPRDESDLPQP
jgi:membrane-associated phospholipid phosphatase